VQPLPETAAALTALAVATDDADVALVDEFDQAATTTQRIAPDCVGLTLTFAQGDLSFTWVASDLDAAAPDPLQPSEGHGAGWVDGPSVTADAAADDPVDEQAWQAYGAASARSGVSSTLSIPLMSKGTVYGEVDLYGRTPSAFDGHHEELAALYGGWAGGAVTNADLSFATMARARIAPGVLAELSSSNVAVGMIMAARDVPEAAARHTLADIAARTGVSPGAVADILLDTRLL
jgi:hypothetical protein